MQTSKAGVLCVGLWRGSTQSQKHFLMDVTLRPRNGDITDGGEDVVEIPLTQGKVAVVDDDMAHLLRTRKKQQTHIKTKAAN